MAFSKKLTFLILAANTIVAIARKAFNAKLVGAHKPELQLHIQDFQTVCVQPVDQLVFKMFAIAQVLLIES